MAGELIILPVRIGVGAARFALRSGMRMTGEALELIGGALKSASGDGSQAANAWPAPPSRVPQASPPTRQPLPRQPPPRAQQQTSPAPRATPSPQDAPAHVSEEPTIVEEVAEPGAEDGAGAEVTVAEPWNGYRKMKARDVIDRLAATSAAELAAVQLYENAHRHRDTVMTAVRRELRIRSGSGAPAAEKLRKE